MKKVRIFLGVLALVFAVGGTFASQYQPNSFVTGWEYVPSTGACNIQENLCTTDGTIDCAINGHKVKNSSTASQCGTQLQMPN